MERSISPVRSDGWCSYYRRRVLRYDVLACLLFVGPLTYFEFLSLMGYPRLLVQLYKLSAALGMKRSPPPIIIAMGIILPSTAILIMTRTLMRDDLIYQYRMIPDCRSWIYRHLFIRIMFFYIVVNLLATILYNYRIWFISIEQTLNGGQFRNQLNGRTYFFSFKGTLTHILPYYLFGVMSMYFTVSVGLAILLRHRFRLNGFLEFIFCLLVIFALGRIVHQVFMIVMRYNFGRGPKACFLTDVLRRIHHYGWPEAQLFWGSVIMRRTVDRFWIYAGERDGPLIWPRFLAEVLLLDSVWVWLRRRTRAARVFNRYKKADI